MVNKIDTVINSLVLIHYEYKLDNQVDSDSFIKELLSKLITGNTKLATMNLDTSIVNILMSYIDEVLLNNYDTTTFLNKLKLLLVSFPDYYNIIEEQILKELDIDQLKVEIIRIRKLLRTIKRELDITSIISSASYTLSKNSNQNVDEIVSDLIGKLETLVKSDDDKVSGLISEVNFSNPDSVKTTIDIIQELELEDGKFSTGWKELNRMLEGGFSRGEIVTICGLQHEYKSGLVHSLFAQFCMENNPKKLIVPGKKPAILFISLEDQSEKVIKFLYEYIYYNENKELPDLNKSGIEISNYITEKLSQTGFTPLLVVADPNEWNWMNIKDRLLYYESQGYEIQVMFIDYISKLQTKYCNNAGPTGTDVRDLFGKLKSLINVKDTRKTLLISPHQISTEALNLLRNGINNMSFIEEIANKNYYSESKQIPQIIDTELYLKKGIEEKVTYLFVGLGKRRGGGVIPQEYKRAKLRFPEKAPIPSNIHETTEEFNKIDINKYALFD
jgi:archaellum biogenesis ATPase FlaH